MSEKSQSPVFRGRAKDPMKCLRLRQWMRWAGVESFVVRASQRKIGKVGLTILLHRGSSNHAPIEAVKKSGWFDGWWVSEPIDKRTTSLEIGIETGMPLSEAVFSPVYGRHEL